MRNNTFVFFCLVLVVSSSASESVDSFGYGDEASKNQELLFGNRQVQCIRSLDRCEAVNGGTELPYAEWMDTLDRIDETESEVVSDIKSIVVSASMADFSQIAQQETLVPVNAVTVKAAAAEIQTMVAQLQNLNIEDDPGTTASQTGGSLMRDIINFFKRTFGIDLSFLIFLQDLFDLFDASIAAIPRGISAFLTVTLTGLVVFVMNLKARFLIWILPGQTNSVPSDQVPLRDCVSDLVECEYNRMVATVVPALISVALVASGVDLSELDVATP